MTTAEALALLPDGEHIHTFTRSMIGADWPRERMVAVLNRPDVQIEEAGGMAKAMGHNLCLVYKGPSGERVLFVQTRREGE